jgi:RNA polymerase sigma factor (sigma-70 family)
MGDQSRDLDERDADLQRRVAMGERAPFEELYRLYSAPAYGLALRVTGHALLAQEVVHDAFMALWSAPEAFDPSRGTFRSFFLSLVHHRAVDTVRREDRLRRRSARVNPEPIEDEDVADVVTNHDWMTTRRDDVIRALKRLPPEQREVVELAYFLGMTQARIAEVCGVPLGTVKTRTLAAMRKLRGMLEGEGG